MEELRPVDCVFERMLGDRDSSASTDNVLLFWWGVRSKYSNWREGYGWCAGHGDKLLVQQITEWVEREQRPGYYSSRLEKEVGPYARWVVKLSCGHYAYHVVTEVDWRPEDGYRERPDFAAKIRRRLESNDINDETRRSLEWSIAMHGTEPQMREDCPYCVYMRRVVGCRPVGPLARSNPKEPHKQPSRRALTRRLNAAEANVGRLREQLTVVC
jgi:hypothetical protein